MKTLIKILCPPLFWILLQKLHLVLNNLRYKPEEAIVKSGILKGISLYINKNSPIFKKMVEGDYDLIIYDKISKLNISFDCFVDIGAHIGYHSLSFAQLIKGNGLVYAFEPNPYNLERIQKNIALNPSLKGKISVHNCAIGESKGKSEFHFSRDVDGGRSSGGFIGGSNTFYNSVGFYKKALGFEKMQVEIMKLDDFEFKKFPNLIKIDVEGAEHLVLKGMKHLLENAKPALFIEIHSIFNMFEVYIQLQEMGYRIELLHQEEDGRLIIYGEAIK